MHKVKINEIEQHMQTIKRIKSQLIGMYLKANYKQKVSKTKVNK